MTCPEDAVKLNRNDPCHCGSGKKYKKCHMESDEARTREVRQLDTLAEWVAFYRREMHEAVTARAIEATAVVTAARGWFGDAPTDAPLADPLFAEHALYDLAITEDGPLIAEAEVEPRGAEATHLENLRKALAGSHLSLIEVVENKPGRGVRLHDRLADVRRFVGDPELAGKLEPMEVVLGRLVMYGDKPVLLPDWEKVYFRGRKA
ncbi:MAG: SEC-C domain-containing protein, partial [Myxococcales bacterium]|nr:SEC-C domain-containing protein [Myxococcales bacterium]